jgi:peptide/nickel transport system substrate-binding protein/oligopeptide transport system substrate-binding protein
VKSLVFLLAGLVAASLASGVDAGARAADATSGDLRGFYRRPLGNEPATLDPARIGDIYSRSISQQIFDGLVQFDRTLMVAPALASFWKASRDGRTWTFKLRRGVRFHHGREVTADDVIYSLTRLLDPSRKSGAAELFLAIRGAREFSEARAKTVAGLTAPDPYTVEISLGEPFAQFVSVLAIGHAKIVPRDVVEALGEQFGSQPIGTGPFKFVRWVRGKEIVLGANQDYFDGPPKLSGVVYKIFPGEAIDAMFRAFREGELEDSPIPLPDRERAEGMPYQYIRRPMFSVRFYGLNARHKPLDDPRVRRAIAHAIDREGLLSEIFRDRYHPARGVLPPGTPGYNPELEPIPYAPSRARQLLKEAGFGGARPVPLVIWSSVRSERIVREHEVLRKQLAEVGVQAEFRYETSWPAFSRMLAEGKIPAFLYAWYADVPDPDNFLYKLFYSKSPRNFFGYANPSVDLLLERARGETELRTRVDLYRRAEQLIVRDAIVVPIWHYTYERLFQPYVRSVEVNGLGDPYIPLRKIWLDRGERPAR